MDGALLDWALATFSGYGAADALSEGPSCVLSAVDHRQDQRMLSEGLDHEPHHADLTVFVGRFQTALADRDRALKGITTDGSAPYPEPIRTVFGDVRQQLCPFPGIQDLPQGVVPAGAPERDRLATSPPTLGRGRPSSTDKEARRLARKSPAMQQKIREVFPDRFVFVKRRRTPAERQRLRRITRGLPQVRTLRDIMEHLYAFFARRCRPPTALGKLRKLRQWVQRFTWMGETVTKVCSPTLEHALPFLDDTLLPATSPAVERGNRRYRKMPKSVDRVRSKVC
jgi:hypothetical protein